MVQWQKMLWLTLSGNVLSDFPPLTSHQCQTDLGELLQPMVEGKCLIPSPKKERKKGIVACGAFSAALISSDVYELK